MKPTSKEWKPMKEDQDGGIDTFLEEYELNDNPTALTLRRLLGEAFSSKDAQKYNGARVALNRVANLWIGDEDEDDDDKPAWSNRRTRRRKSEPRWRGMFYRAGS
jgi:hypothetical protein